MDRRCATGGWSAPGWTPSNQGRTSRPWRLDRAPPEEQENLLAVSQIFAQMRYNDPSLLSIFGGRIMGWFEESPLVQAVVDNAVLRRTRKNLMQVLEARFGALDSELRARLEGVGDEQELSRLIDEAARCPSLDEFRAKLLSPPPP